MLPEEANIVAPGFAPTRRQPQQLEQMVPEGARMFERPFRFGLSLAQATSRQTWIDTAQRAEDLGYGILLVPDHFGDHLAPIAAIMAAADATRFIRVGSLVFDNDFRH